jgi:hypothetical protein
MPFVRRQVRLIGGTAPEARRGGRSKKAGGPKSKTGKRSLTEAKKAEITAALLAKWEREGVGRRRQGPGANPPGRGEKTKKPVTAKGRPAQAQQPSKKLAPQRRKRKPPRPIAQKELRRRQHQPPGAEYLLAFFRAAGVRAELVRGGCLWINGSQIELSWTLSAPTTHNLNYVIDEMALKYAREEFIQAVKDNARFGQGLRVVLQWRERGFAIMRDDVRLAVLHATHAFIPHRKVIYANFLKPGPHWQQVADVLRGAELELMAEWKREQEAKAAAEAAAAAAKAERSLAIARRRIDHLPDDLAPELIAACLDASRRIRLERQVAYERPVILECDFGELRLLPITGPETRLLMPFRLNTGTETLRGELILGDHDPLPVLIDEGIADRDAITAWICALLGFADATCIELEPVEPTPRRELARPGWPRSSSVIHRPPSARTVPRRRAWPSHLEPVGHWIRYSSSFVAGHRRRLNEGQMASAEARDRARQVGIFLHPHETWVRPHTRGVPDNIEMRFLWRSPTELKLSRALVASRGGSGRAAGR